MTISPYTSDKYDDDDYEKIVERSEASLGALDYEVNKTNTDEQLQASQERYLQRQVQPTGEQPAVEQPQEQPQEQAQQPEEEFDPSKDFSYYEAQGMSRGEWNKKQMSGGVDAELSSFATDPQESFEAALSVPTGFVDGFTDMYNFFLPGPDIPKIPKFKSQSAQGIRDLTSIIGPLFTGIGALGGGARALHAAGKFNILGRTVKIPKVVQALGDNPIFKFFAKHGLEGGVGVAVDVSNRTSEDANIQRMARDFLGTKDSEKLFGIFPGSWATQKNDPDGNRRKNAMEGFGLGIVVGIGEGLTKLARGISGTNEATKFVPKNNAAKDYFESLKKDEFSKIKYDDDPMVDSLLRAEARNQAALDDLADYVMVKRNAENVETGQPFQQFHEMEFEVPVKGVHEDAFDIGENGVRAVDPDGVPGAMVDAVRIQKNYDTVNGRLGSMVTESALKYGLDAADGVSRVVVRKIMKEIKESGKFDYLLNGRIITDSEIDEAGTLLASKMAGLDVEDMKELLDQFKRLDDSLGGRVVNSVGYDAVVKTMKSDLEAYTSLFDPDEAKAAAYLTHSLAGQVSDMAQELPKLEGTAAIDAVAEPILTRLQYLMTEKALASYDAGSVLRNMNTWERLKRLGKKPNIAEDLEQRTRFLRGVIDDSKRYAAELKSIAKEKPNFLKPLYEAFAFTNGDVDTMYKLNNYVRKNLSNIHKAFIDGDPEIPNHIVQGFWANFYNSTLSATATPIKAFLGNAGGLIARPITSMAGALMEGDLKFIRRAAYQYAGFGDAFMQAWNKSGQFLKLAAENPAAADALGRPDLLIKQERNLSLLDTFAEAALKDGNDGPAILLEIVRNQQNMAGNQWMAFSKNMMSAWDIGVKAFIATAEARGNAIDTVLSTGASFRDYSRISRKAKKKIIDAEFNSMWEADGLQLKKDVSARYMSSEIALNLDGALSNGINEIVKNYPMLKPWFLFPRTSTNMVGMFQKYSPLQTISSDFWDFATPGKNLDQIPFDHMEAVLKKKGITPKDDYFSTFTQMRYEMKGRMAAGTGAVFAGAWAFQNGRLRGNGHWDENIQRARGENNWKKKTYLGDDGKWHSYEFLGPMGDWLAATADVFDNFDSLSYATTEKMLQKMSFIIGASLFDRSVFAMMEPLNDVLNGNGSAGSRWASSFVNNAAPLGGLRGQFSRLLSDGLKEVDDDFIQLIRNRNNYLDLINPSGANPDAFDWIDGGRIGAVEDVFQRFTNVLTGMPTSDRLSPERRFLVAIEFDGRLAAKTNPDGIKYEPEERAAIYSKIGELGSFKAKVQEMMAENEIMQYVKDIEAARRRGVTSEELAMKRTILHNRLNTALADAVREATSYLEGPMREAIDERSQIFRMNKEFTKTNDYNNILIPTR